MILPLEHQDELGENFLERARSAIISSTSAVLVELLPRFGR
jgi:hypothetical protein